MNSTSAITAILTAWQLLFSRNCRKHGLFASTSCLRIYRQKKKIPAPITQSSPMKLNKSLRDLPSTTETNSCSKRLTSSSPTSDIRGEEQPSTSYWQKRKTGESSSFPHKNTTHTPVFNSIIHFSTWITSLFFSFPRIALYFQLLR